MVTPSESSSRPRRGVIGSPSLPWASGRILSASVNGAAAAVGGQALSAIRHAAASAGSAVRTSIALPSGHTLALSSSRFAARQPGAITGSREVDFEPSFLDSFPPPTEPEGTAPGGLLPKEIAALALAYSYESVFSTAHKRISYFFKINVGVCLFLASTGLVGIAGCLFAALFFDKVLWAVALGGIGITTWVGLFVFKPLDRVNSALNASVKLDMLVVRLRQQLETCTKHTDLKDLVDCQTNVWEAIQQELLASEVT